MAWNEDCFARLALLLRLCLPETERLVGQDRRPYFRRWYGSMMRMVLLFELISKFERRKPRNSHLKGSITIGRADTGP